MTTYPAAPVTEQTGDLLDLLANDPRKADDYDRFTAALRACVRDGWVSANTVRAALSNEHGLTIEPRRYSSLWRRACGDGLLEFHAEDPECWELNLDQRGRNRGKPQRRYKWTGGAQ